jgi:hypothetical protein
MPKSNWQDFVMGFGNPLTKHGRERWGNIFQGTPEKREARLLPEQQALWDQLQAALQGEGAGGAFGQSADYYRDLLSDDSETARMMEAPEMRRFNEQIIPGLSEQFAGMGAGNLSSSGFRNAAVGAGTDLSERLGAMRANLRSQGAQGLSNLGAQGLQDMMMITPRTPGLLESLAPAIGTATGAYFGGPAGAAVGNAAGQGFSSMFSGGGGTPMRPGSPNALSPKGVVSSGGTGGTPRFGSTSPYGGSFGQLPNFQSNMR